MQLRIVVLLILFGFSASSQAATVSVSLPSLSGIYSISDPYSAVRGELFNLGVQFSFITSASVELTGISTPGSERTCDASIGTCSVSSFEPSMYAGLISREVVPNILGGSHEFDFSTANNRNVGIWPLDFSNPSFLSGNGRLNLLLGNPTTGFVLDPGTIDISNVRLTVEGTVVPIPAALPLLMSGLTGLLFFQRKRKLA